ncbi:hypothetical protein N431DRAFT_470949 [Stipitochalara longipes BDJ]|nr:hypothetical protein N431DRAFT_470949 [Stipitochalara longipes BDJ]
MSSKAVSFIAMIKTKETPRLTPYENHILSTIYKDLIEDIYMWLTSYAENEPESTTNTSNKRLKTNLYLSRTAMANLLKARLAVKMRKWPPHDGKKSETVGIALLQNLLDEMESRDVPMERIERMVAYVLRGYKEKAEQKEREETTKGDEMEGIETESVEMADMGVAKVEPARVSAKILEVGSPEWLAREGYLMLLNYCCDGSTGS